MARISVIGGTGYAGSNIVTEAANRGHAVTAYSRKAPEAPVEGVQYVQADVTDPATLDEAVEGADVVIGALSPRGDLTESFGAVYDSLAEKADSAHVRLGIVGGAGGLEVAPGKLLVDTPDLPEAVRPESRALIAVLDALQATPDSLDWFYVAPAANFGAFNAGSRTGSYRVGTDQVLSDDKGESNISGADFAVAIVDEIQVPTHHRARFTVAY